MLAGFGSGVARLAVAKLSISVPFASAPLTVATNVIVADAPLASGFRKVSPLHFTLLGNDVLIIENLANLKSVCGRVTYVYAVPIKIEGAYGAPARVLAKELDA